MKAAQSTQTLESAAVAIEGGALQRAGRSAKSLWDEHSVFLAFAAVLTISSLISAPFFTATNLLNIVRQVSVVGIISLGMTLVIISGGIDLSVGAVLALSGGCAMLVLEATGSPVLAVAAALAAGVATGAFSGMLITRGRVPPFIATLGMLAGARSLVLFTADGGSISASDDGYGAISNGELLGIAYPIWYFLLVTAVLYVVTTRTTFGRYMYAIGSNERAARLSAIRVSLVKFYVYVLCGALTAFGAIIESSRLNSVSSANSGLNYELDAIAAVIIGGTRMSGGRGRIVGTFFGVLILGMLNNMLNLMGVSPYLQGLVKGAIIVLAVLMQRKE